MPAARHTMLHSSDTRDEYLSAIAPPPILPTALAPSSMLKANAALVGVTPCPVMYSARCCWIPVSVCAAKKSPNPNIQNIGCLDYVAGFGQAVPIRGGGRSRYTPNEHQRHDERDHHESRQREKRV